MTLLQRIDLHIARTGTTPTRFGRDAVGDPNLIRDLRKGRRPRPGMLARLHDFLASAGKADR